MLLSEDQFNRIFPFHFRMDAHLNITSVGVSLNKVHKISIGSSFGIHFSVKRPFVEINGANIFPSLLGQVVVIAVKDAAHTLLRGQFELLTQEDELLFIGSPWFDASEKLVATGLNLGDFAPHDPLPDLLHLLKTQELANVDLKELLGKVNNQRVALKKAGDELTEMAQFFKQHPDPHFRIHEDGSVLMKNDAASGLESFSYNGQTYPTDQLWAMLAPSLSRAEQGTHLEVAADSTIYSFFCLYAPGSCHYNIFGRDITRQKEKEDRLKILSQIAESNVNAVIITDNQGRITWVNKSFSRITGYAMQEVLGKKPGHFLQGPNTDPDKVAYLKTQIAAKQPFAAELVNYNKSGRPYWVRVLGQPIHNNNGSHYGFFAIEEDITREREIQDRINESEARFRLVLEKTGDNVWEHDFRTGKTYFSKLNGSLLGLGNNASPDNESLWWNRIYKDDLYMVVNADMRYRRGESDSHNMEYRIVQTDGTISWVLDRGVVIERDADGKPLRIIGTHTDITRIKQTEYALEQRVKQFKSLSENIPGVIYEYEFRPDGTEGFCYLSPAMERIFGIAPADFENYINWVHRDDLEQLREKNRHSKQTLEPFYFECRMVIPNVGIRWHSIQSSFSYVSQAGAVVYTGMMLDITERKNAEETLRANEEKYRSIIANMNLGLIEVDNDETISYANQGFCNMSGYTLDGLIGKNASKLFVKGKNAEIMQQKNKARQTGQADAYEIGITDMYGQERWWLVSGAPRYNDNGELVGSIGIHLDITEQKKLQKELIEAREKAENLARTKENFLANMSHEIRTPMNAIMGMGQQLAKTSLTQHQQLFLNTINTASENLLVIINDILDLSKIEAGKLVIEEIGFEPADLATKTVQAMSLKASEKGIKLLKPLIDEHISPVLVGDPNRIGQVLLNLLSNAIKFTEDGTVGLSISLKNDSDTSQLVQVVVTDTGIGMDEAFLNHLFDKFSQENDSISRKYGGTGLGMSICKQLIELMGGTIEVASTKGKGTTIAFYLALKKGTFAQIPEKNTATFNPSILKGKRILITDDNELNRLVASVTLTHYGALISEASSGQQAINMAAEQVFDLVLMDVQMPEMDGYEAATRIRAFNEVLPIIAFTAKAIKGEREKCIGAGMNDYITKPFKEEDLVKMVARHCGLVIKTEKQAPQQSIDKTQRLYDLNALITMSRGNDDFVQKMVDLFCDNTPVSLREMMGAHRAGNFEAMAGFAHKMKPSIDYLNIATIKETIRRIEKIGRDKTDLDALPELLRFTEQVIEEVIEAMRKSRPNT